MDFLRSRFGFIVNQKEYGMRKSNRGNIMKYRVQNGVFYVDI